MVQACVMVQPELECGTQQCMLTPTRPQTKPLVDNTLITSTVRKRKDVGVGSGQDKKLRQVPIDTAAPDTLLSPAAAQNRENIEARTTHDDAPTAAAAPQYQQPHQFQPPNHQHHEGDPQEGELFSPTFQLLPKDAAGSSTNLGPEAAQHVDPDLLLHRPHHLCEPYISEEEAAVMARPGTPQAENTSTDASTGTSASLGMDNASEGVMVPLGSPGPTSPPPAQQAATQENDEDEEYLDFDPFVFIKRLPPLERCVPPRTTFLLPRQTRRSKQKTLVLDLDETLVHSTLDGDCVPDFTFPVDLGHIRHIVAVRKRPYLHEFLNRVAQLFEVVVFTASQRVYAEQLLDLVDPGRKLIRHRVYRENCVFWEGNYLKDLTVLGRDLRHTLIVDNSPQAFGFQLDNGVPIESWYDDHQDQELLNLLPFLESIAAADDVRPHIQNRFGLRRLVEASSDPLLQLQRRQMQLEQQQKHEQQG